MISRRLLRLLQPFCSGSKEKRPLLKATWRTTSFAGFVFMIGVLGLWQDEVKKGFSLGIE